tara:strand:- start:35 stop:550 length:516 start_codon:yes stop_codon:yes gene_type:complete
MDGKTIVLFLLLFLYSSQAMANIYNNPSNIESGQGFAGETGTVYAERFSVFDTPEMGLRATFRDLRTKMKEFDGDVDKIITKFAPPTENVTSNYINRIKKSIGKDKKITNKNLIKVVKEMVAIESADNPKMIKYYLENPAIINVAEELSYIDMPSNTLGKTAKKLYYEGEF